MLRNQHLQELGEPLLQDKPLDELQERDKQDLAADTKLNLNENFRCFCC